MNVGGLYVSTAAAHSRGSTWFTLGWGEIIVFCLYRLKVNNWENNHESRRDQHSRGTLVRVSANTSTSDILITWQSVCLVFPESVYHLWCSMLHCLPALFFFGCVHASRLLVFPFISCLFLCPLMPSGLIYMSCFLAEKNFNLFRSCRQNFIFIIFLSISALSLISKSRERVGMLPFLLSIQSKCLPVISSSLFWDSLWMCENTKVSPGRCGIEGSQPMSEGKCHLLQLVRHSHPLIGPPLSRHTSGLCSHLSLQFLQTLLHMRRHLQTARRRTPLVMQNITVAGNGSKIWEMRHQEIKRVGDTNISENWLGVITSALQEFPV